MDTAPTKNIDNTLNIALKDKFFKDGSMVYKVYNIKYPWAKCLYIYPKGEFGWISFKLSKVAEDEEITKKEFMDAYIKLLMVLDDLTTRI